MDSRTVLLLDADLIGRSTVERYLREQGYRVMAADDGVAGMELFQRTPADLVIIDIMLPRRSAFSMIEQIKRASPQARVIMLSNMDGPAHRALAELLGADEYLLRPVSMNRLYEVVRRLCPLPPVDSEAAAKAPQAVTSHAG